MTTTATFEVVFPEWYDERGEWEAKSKGWLQGVEIRFSTGHAEPLFFYDPVRLAQDLQEDAKQGRPYVAIPGLIVIPEITRDAMVRAVNALVAEDYFSTQKGVNGALRDPRVGSFVA